jgi:nucleoside phosphorylase
MTEVKHQIYVSYADADKDWVVHFVNGLKVYLRKQLGEIDDNFIWAKFMPLGLGNKQEILQRHLKASEYLLVILSPAYLKTMGNSEIDLFGKIDALILVEHSRVSLPDDLQYLSSHPFWYEDERGRIVQIGFPVPDVNERKYFHLLAEIAHDITQSHNHVSNQQPTEPNLSADSKTSRSPGVSAPSQASIHPQCVVITVTDTEDSAFRDVLKGHKIEPPTFQKHEHLGYYYNRFFLQNQHCALIRPTEKGRDASRTLVNKLLRYPPQLIIMMGICGGFNERGVKLNDVIFAHSIIDYERERLTDDKYRAGIQPQQYRTSPHLLELIANFKTELAQELKIRIHHEKILASGDKLLAAEHELRQKILNIHSDIYGIEMEGSSFYRAVHDAQIAHLDVTVIKAVSDFGDAQMAKGKEKKQQKAAKIAAQVTLKVIEQYFAS